MKKPTPRYKISARSGVYGCFLDMAGNVWESGRPIGTIVNITAMPPTKTLEDLTWLRKRPYFGRPEEVGISIYELKPSQTSKALSGCKGYYGVDRWNGSGVVHIRCANRHYDELIYKNDTIGFRCLPSGVVKVQLTAEVAKDAEITLRWFRLAA